VSALVVSPFVPAGAVRPLPSGGRSANLTATVWLKTLLMAALSGRYFFFGSAIPVSASHTRITNESSFRPCPFAAAARNS
jgi:hypothetical protein